MCCNVANVSRMCRECVANVLKHSVFEGIGKKIKIKQSVFEGIGNVGDDLADLRYACVKRDLCSRSLLPL